MLEVTPLIGAEALETPPCPMCGESAVRQKRYRLPPHEIVCCQQCELWYLSPRLTEAEMLKIYARDDYFSNEDYGYSDYAAQESGLRRTFAAFLKQLQQRTGATGSLLEIGCGHGYLLAEAAHRFNPRTGTDFSQEAANIAREQADDIHLGGLESLPASKTFDTTISIEVIEHVYDLHAFMQGLVDRTNQHGIVAIATPNMGSIWRHLFANKWPSFLPEHISYFDRATLTRLMEQHGLTDIQPIPFPHAYPLSLIQEKLGLPSFAWMNSINLWVPGTVVALAGKKP